MRSARLDAILAVATCADVLRLGSVAPPKDVRGAIICPLPGHHEASPSFCLQRSEQGFRCHGCGAHGGVLELVVALGLARDRGGAVELLGEQYRIPPDDKGDGSWKATRHVMQQRKVAAAFALPPNEPEREATSDDREALRSALRGREPLNGTPGASYLASRGLCAAAASVSDARFHPSWLGRGSAIVFAVRDLAGSVVAAQGRFLEPSMTPKAMTKGPVGLGVYATMGALDPRAEVVAIVEAPLDALSLAVCELPAIALCGSTNRPAWLRRELAFRAVVLATDADAAGDAAAEDLRAWLNLGTRCSRLVLPAGCKDANELLRRDPADALRIVRKARPSTSSDILDAGELEGAS